MVCRPLAFQCQWMLELRHVHHAFIQLQRDQDIFTDLYSSLLSLSPSSNIYTPDRIVVHYQTDNTSTNSTVVPSLQQWPQ